ncbi:MAG: hypothetical protein LAP13_02470 [Acidobacteriia bacterium]|nr:hypothetical protein [Terriglobia bacterium]
MFERYTEKARRAIFFARYEASQFGSPYIETEHMLLGLLREDKTLATSFLRRQASVESIRKEIEGRRPIRDKVATSVDLPISQECKRVLEYAPEEADRLGHKHIGTEHLLLALLRVEKSLAAEILHERGLTLATVREEVSKAQKPESAPARAEDSSLLLEFSRDLTKAAQENQLDPLFGRENELNHVVQILCRRSRSNPLLIGEPGVGKSAIVHGLAQRIAKGDVPPRLATHRLLAFDFSTLLVITRRSGQIAKRLTAFLDGLAEEPPVLVYIEELLASGSLEGSVDIAGVLRPLLSSGQLQCLGAGTPAEYRQAVEKYPWLEQYFQAVEVSPPTEAEAVQILFAIKGRYETFHGVTYADDALEHAVYYSQRFMPQRHLPDKAIDLIDEAGAGVVLRAAHLPEEVIDCQKRIKSAVNRMENAIANHEFEKMRFYSDEERKERENLRLLREKYHLDETATRRVTLEDIEEVVSRWTGVPIATIRQERREPGPSQDKP